MSNDVIDNNIHFPEKKNSLKSQYKDRLQRNWKVFLYIAGILCFFAVVCGVSYFLSRVYSVSIVMESDHADNVRVFFSYPPVSSQFIEEMSVSGEVLPKKKRVFSFEVPAIPTTRVKIDLGEKPGVVKLYKIVFEQDISRKVVLSYKDIYSGFHCMDDAGCKMTLKEGFVQLSFSGKNCQIVSAKKILKSPLPLVILIPISIMIIFFFRIIAGYPARRIFPLFFPRRKQPSSNTSVIAPLDGLRGFAVLLVVAEHTWHPFLGAGRSGVFIFFSLSGFLLARPYILNPEILFSRANLFTYLQRRIERIIPLYFTYLFLIYGVSLHLGAFLMHALFLKGNGHLWTLPQEMLFYLFFPVILFINRFLLRNNLFFIVIFSFIVIGGWYSVVPLESIYLYGMTPVKLPFMLPAFLSGTVFSYLYYRFLIKITPSREVKTALSVVAVMILFIFTFFSNAQLLHGSEIYAFKYRVSFEICAALLIVILIFAEDTFLTKIFSNFFLTSTGVVSYGLYLFHPLVIPLVSRFHPAGGLRFIITFFISYCIACCTYHLLEGPFLARRSKNRGTGTTS